ncbi:Acyl dehydratase [Pseudidiomarina indica]|uniref:Acyl dehydratase n=1 Tax=Pseudidiomarina indica TaxID=1159017 RepID=A0A1G6ATT5_9GAMM|nr:MaoC family dehydratase [Pseudidiomarina indica]SDB11791.1 Acyl dehydratase [Pseudidiomarina indica]
MNISAEDIGKELGVSEWISFTQEEIDAFGKLTRDIDPYHMNPEWAQQHSPFKTTIAYGFLTLSMLSHFTHEILDWPTTSEANPEGIALNYGFDKVRFLAPVPVNARIRCRLTLAALEEVRPGEWLRTFHCEVELEGSTKLALVAIWKGLFVANDAGKRLTLEN